jgi:hypothetical protein
MARKYAASYALASMRIWVTAVVMSAGCMMQPSEEQVACYQDCARAKDACMLQASTPSHVQACDDRGTQCTAVCP